MRLFINLITRFVKTLYVLYNRVFTFSNFLKVSIIFLLGLFSRYLVNHVWDVNVFVDYTNIISVFYYFIFSIFVVLINDLFTFLDFSIPTGGMNQAPTNTLCRKNNISDAFNSEYRSNFSGTSKSNNSKVKPFDSIKNKFVNAKYRLKLVKHTLNWLFNPGSRRK